MGNREALLSAARRCLDDKGYGRTTARDVASAAGVSLAAIGYHFGTTRAVLDEAVYRGVEEWAADLHARVGRRVRDLSPGPERFAALVDGVVESFEGRRGVLVARYEVSARTEVVSDGMRAWAHDRVDTARAKMARRLGVAVGAGDPDGPGGSGPDDARAAGSFWFALVGGLVAQWLADPDSVPTGADLAAGVVDVVYGDPLPSPTPAASPPASPRPTGNRGALLAAARECLLANGYRRTTARDVASAAGVSLAAIGYHFGTVRALLDEAVLEGLAEWTGGLTDLVRHRVAPGTTGTDRFAVVWDCMVASLDGYRGVLGATQEMRAWFPSDPALHAEYARRLLQSRRDWAGLTAGVDPGADPERAQRLGDLYFVLTSGLVTHWLVAPDGVPGGADVAGMLVSVAGGRTRPSADVHRTDRLRPLPESST